MNFLINIVFSFTDIGETQQRIILCITDLDVRKSSIAFREITWFTALFNP